MSGVIIMSSLCVIWTQRGGQAWLSWPASPLFELFAEVRGDYNVLPLRYLNSTRSSGVIIMTSLSVIWTHRGGQGWSSCPPAPLFELTAEVRGDHHVLPLRYLNSPRRSGVIIMSSLSVIWTHRGGQGWSSCPPSPLFELTAEVRGDYHDLPLRYLNSPRRSGVIIMSFLSVIWTHRGGQGWSSCPPSPLFELTAEVRGDYNVLPLRYLNSPRRSGVIIMSSLSVIWSHRGGQGWLS